MSDFRSSLYERYVSDFKGRGAQPGRSSSIWRSYTYGPILHGLDRTLPILELGCGAGQMLQFLGELGFRHIRGIDISEEQIRLARNAGCNAEVADGNKYLAEHPATFQAILALDFVEHFHREELLALTVAMFAALRPGGHLILQTPNGAGLFSGQIVFGDMTHLTIFTPGSLRQLLQRAGFDTFQFYETRPTARGLVGTARGLIWNGVRGVANLIRRVETGKTQEIWTENMICVCRRPA